jgi:transcriptional regulator with XRE-family HTH domain
MPPSSNGKPDKRVLIAYGSELRRLREEAGFTQTSLGRRVNTSKTTVSDVERGRIPPSPQLRTDLDELLGKGRLSHLWKELTVSGGEVWKYEIAELIDGASAVYEYEVLVFPAYLQTETYAQAIIRQGAPWLKSEEVSRLAQERWKRAPRLAEARSVDSDSTPTAVRGAPVFAAMSSHPRRRSSSLPPPPAAAAASAAFWASSTMTRPR